MQKLNFDYVLLVASPLYDDLQKAESWIPREVLGCFPNKRTHFYNLDTRWQVIRQKLKGSTYETKTRGTRHQPAARPCGVSRLVHLEIPLRDRFRGMSE